MNIIDTIMKYNLLILAHLSLPLAWPTHQGLTLCIFCYFSLLWYFPSTGCLSSEDYSSSSYLNLLFSLIFLQVWILLLVLNCLICLLLVHWECWWKTEVKFFWKLNGLMEKVIVRLDATLEAFLRSKFHWISCFFVDLMKAFYWSETLPQSWPSCDDKEMF